MGLVEDYLMQDPALRGFYATHPCELLKQPMEHGAWGAGMVDALAAWQETLGAPKAVLADSTVFATGQQPGIFTGPLYSIYKAITAIQLARRYTEAHGLSATPVFWVAGDDHDFEEVRTAYLLTKQFEPLPLTYAPAEYVEGAAMYQTPATPALHALIDEAAARCSGEFRDEVCAYLHDSAEQAESVAHWFALVMARLFRDTPLCIFAPHLPAARVAAAPVFAHEIAHPLVSTQKNNATAEVLAGLGYPPQVVKGADECSFFVDYQGRRRKVLWDGANFQVPAERATLSQAEMASLLQSAPERFSANVVLRPVVQQTLFPVAAYVGGPGEMAYWLQLKDVFEHFGAPMPVVYPRAQALLLDTKTRKLRDKFGFGHSEWYDPIETLEPRALRGVVRNPVLDALREHRAGVQHAVDALVCSIDRSAGKDRNPGERSRQFAAHTMANLDKLEHSFAQADQQQAQTVRQQLQRVVNTMAPFRKPQERVYSVVPWLFEQGWELVPRLLERLDATAHGVQEVEL